jgi:hypothetical protein
MTIIPWFRLQKSRPTGTSGKMLICVVAISAAGASREYGQARLLLVVFAPALAGFDGCQ